MSRPPTSSRPPQSALPQSQAPSRPPQSQAPPSMSGASMRDPRSRPSSVAPAQSVFDPRQAQSSQASQASNASQASASQARGQVYRPIDSNTKKIIPSTSVMMQAVTISLEKDKPIIATFWWDSILRNVFLSSNPKERETIIEKIKENPDDEAEFTSRIMKDHGNGIFETENSIYIVVPDIQRR